MTGLVGCVILLDFGIDLFLAPNGEGTPVFGRFPFVIMQLDLQSVGKSTFQYVRMSFCPENVEKLSSLPKNESEPSPELFPAFPSCRKSPSAPFRSNWVKYNCNPPSDCFFFRSDGRLES